MREEAAAPEWNEQRGFGELFPPLTRGLRLQLRDDAPLVDAALATHVLDLRQISHSGRAGELIWPTPPTTNRILATHLRLESEVRPPGQTALEAGPFGASPVVSRYKTPPLA